MKRLIFMCTLSVFFINYNIFSQNDLFPKYEQSGQDYGMSFVVLMADYSYLGDPERPSYNIDIINMNKEEFEESITYKVRICKECIEESKSNHNLYYYILFDVENAEISDDFLRNNLLLRMGLSCILNLEYLYITNKDYKSSEFYLNHEKALRKLIEYITEEIGVEKIDKIFEFVRKEFSENNLFQEDNKFDKDLIYFIDLINYNIECINIYRNWQRVK